MEDTWNHKLRLPKTRVFYTGPKRSKPIACTCGISRGQQWLGEESVYRTVPLGKGDREEDPYITLETHLSEDLRYQQWLLQKELK